FRDRDGDGYGSNDPKDKSTRCRGTGWVEQAGDCFDAEVTTENHAALVHPGQTDVFAEGYPSPGKPDDVSFDYDCDGEEVGDSRDIAGDCSSDNFPGCGAAN